MELADITNKIIHADCLDLMRELPKGKIDLIYIDPPFCCDADKKFGMVSWAKNTQQRNDIDDILPLVSKQDNGLANYLRWIYPRLRLMRELLSEKGSIYVHVDWHVGHYVKILMDDIFGKNNFLNEIIWSYKTGGVSKNFFARKHDNLFFYTKNQQEYIFNTQYYRSYQAKKYNYNPNYPELWDEEKKMWYHNSVCRDVWEDINVIGTESDLKERTDYQTQKPEALLERIIKASSNEDSIVADFYAGSGTTGAVAEKLGRRWIMSDISTYAIETMKKRLNKPVVIWGQNR